MQRQIIKFQLDVPVKVKLDSQPEGRERDGRYGPEYQYILNDDQAITWLPRPGRDQVVRSGAQPGDTIEVMKSMHGRAITFSVQVVPDVDPLDEPTTPAPRPVERSNFETALVKAVAGQTNGNGHATGPAQPSNDGRSAGTQTRPPALPRPGADMAAGYLYCAIDAAMAASVYAKERHGWPLQFDAEQVRRLAITLMIGARGEDR